ncbi:AAA family ATPase OS=Lysinibacillus sphaericus OX=1421 GN=LS41612_13425 PE=4 SV=1 [Lysinibacillus sphaericus]
MYLKACKVLQDNIEEKHLYPFNIPSLQDLQELAFPTNVTFFVGENGSGKSTLLEAIADCCEFNTAGGGRQNTYEVHKAESALGDYIRLSWWPKVTNGFFLRSETFYQFASHIDLLEHPNKYAAFGGKSLHHQKNKCSLQ